MSPDIGVSSSPVVSPIDFSSVIVAVESVVSSGKVVTSL